jgi:hypothetical protein
MQRALRDNQPPYTLGENDMQTSAIVNFDASATMAMYDSYRSMTPKERGDAFHEFIAERLKNTMKIAMIVCAMVEAGDPIDHLGFPPSVLDLLADVKSGKLLPQAFDYFSSSIRLQQCISRLPISRQRAFISGESVPLVIWKDGKTECLRMDPRNLLLTQLSQVFDGDHVRDESQQVAWLAEQERKARMKKKAPQDSEPDVEVHVRLKRIVINKAGVTLTAKQLAEYLKQLA